MGISYQIAGFMFAADVDLSENKPYFQGTESQYLALGAEYGLFDFFFLRAGSRINLANEDDLLYTLGFGLGKKALHADIAAEVGDDSAGIALQLGFAF